MNSFVQILGSSPFRCCNYSYSYYSKYSVGAKWFLHRCPCTSHLWISSLCLCICGLRCSRSDLHWYPSKSSGRPWLDAPGCNYTGASSLFLASEEMMTMDVAPSCAPHDFSKDLLDLITPKDCRSEQKPKGIWTLKASNGWKQGGRGKLLVAPFFGGLWVDCWVFLSSENSNRI